MDFYYINADGDIEYPIGGMGSIFHSYVGFSDEVTTNIIEYRYSKQSSHFLMFLSKITEDFIANHKFTSKYELCTDIDPSHTYPLINRNDIQCILLRAHEGSFVKYLPPSYTLKYGQYKSFIPTHIYRVVNIEPSLFMPDLKLSVTTQNYITSSTTYLSSFMTHVIYNKETDPFKDSYSYSVASLLYSYKNPTNSANKKAKWLADLNDYMTNKVTDDITPWMIYKYIFTLIRNDNGKQILDITPVYNESNIRLFTKALVMSAKTDKRFKVQLGYINSVHMSTHADFEHIANFCKDKAHLKPIKKIIKFIPHVLMDTI